MVWAKEMIKNKIRTLGQQVTLYGRDPLVTRAIIVPVNSVSRAARTTEEMADGFFLPGSYQMFALPEVNLEDVEEISDGERHFLVRRRELFCCGDTAMYAWALLIRGGDSHAEA